MLPISSRKVFLYFWWRCWSPPFTPPDGEIGLGVSFAEMVACQQLTCIEIKSHLLSWEACNHGRTRCPDKITFMRYFGPTLGSTGSFSMVACWAGAGFSGAWQRTCTDEVQDLLKDAKGFCEFVLDQRRTCECFCFVFFTVVVASKSDVGMSSKVARTARSHESKLNPSG